MDILANHLEVLVTTIADMNKKINKLESDIEYLKNQNTDKDEKITKFLNIIKALDSRIDPEIANNTGKLEINDKNL